MPQANSACNPMSKMTVLLRPSASAPDRRSKSWRPVPHLAIAAAILFAVTAVRLAALHWSVVDLNVDESQYWVWSRTLAWGYFSKPPLLAWIIAATTEACGNGEACLRAASPLFHLATSALCYAIAANLYDRETAFWAGLTYCLAPAVAFSSRIISTDVPLLFFWALALLALLRMMRGASVFWAVILGAAIGFGALAKYAMLYFLLGVALVAMVEPQARALLRHRLFWLSMAIAVALIAPNIVWNLQNDLVTFQHTTGHVEAQKAGFHFLKGVEFIGGQFLVIGPIAFPILIGIAVRTYRGKAPTQDKWLALMAAPPLLLMLALAFGHGAYANWAAPSAVSAMIAATAVLVRRGWRLVLAINIGLGIVAQLTLMVADAQADRLPFRSYGGKIAPYDRTMGWRSMAEQTRRFMQETGVKSLVADNRYDVASLLYYLRDDQASVFIWPTGRPPKNYFETRNVLTSADARPVLLVTECPRSHPPLSAFYVRIEPLGEFNAIVGLGNARHYYVTKLQGNLGPLAPRTC